MSTGYYGQYYSMYYSEAYSHLLTVKSERQTDTDWVFRPPLTHI